MRQVRPFLRDDEEADGADRQTASLAGLAMALLLIVVGLFLIRHLHAQAAREECLITGRPLVLAGSQAC